MHRTLMIAVVGGLALTLSLATTETASQPAAAPKRTGILAVVEKDMRVGLKELANGYQIQVVPGVDLPFKVAEVGADYVVLDDLLGVHQTRIPIYAIQSVVVTRLPKDK